MHKTLCGAEVYAEIRGEGKRSVLLLHGWGCSTRMMEQAAGVLEKEMRVAALDFPGHGKSGEPPEPWGVPEYMEMTAAFIREMEMAPCDIVAHSFGGRVAILLAATYPELVGRMVLTGAAGIKKPQSGKASFKQKLYKGLRGALDTAEKLHLPKTAAEQAREALVQRFGSPDYRVLSPQMRRTFNKVIAQDLTQELGRIKASTLLYWGADDTETPLWMGQKMEQEIPDAGLVVESGTGHFAYLERAAVFGRILRSFLLEGR